MRKSAAVVLISILILASFLVLFAFMLNIPASVQLETSISSPFDGSEVQYRDEFIISGSVLAVEGNESTVNSFIQYSVGENSTDFKDIDYNDLRIVEGEQMQSQILGSGESYTVSWVLTGELGTYEIRICSNSSIAGNDASEARTVTIVALPPPIGAETVDSEIQDSEVGFGSSSGDYLDTYHADGVYEVLSEEENDQGTETPDDDTTELGWIFTFEGLGQRSNTFLNLLGHAEFMSDDSDIAFEIQVYLLSDWLTITTVVANGYDEWHIIDIPDDSSDTIQIRILDDDRTPGDKAISSLHLDQVYLLDYLLETATSSGMEILTQGYTYSHKIIAWENINQNYYLSGGLPIEEHCYDIVVVDIDSDGILETVVAGGDSTPIIEILQNKDGRSIELEHRMVHPCSEDYGAVTSLAVGDLDNDGGANLEILSCCDAGRIATIWKMETGTYKPVCNISLTSMADAVAAGDLDNDGDIEIVVTAGIGIPGEARVYEYIGEDWVQTAAYYHQGANSEVSHAEINDVDNDGMNELVLSLTYTAAIVLEYNGTHLTKIWESSGIPGHSVTGDITNDGLVDILIVEGASSELIRIFETVGGNIVNTFNILEPGLPTPEGDGIAIGDIDGDGRNEYAILGEGSEDLRIFRNDTLLYRKPFGPLAGGPLEIGDYDNDADDGLDASIVIKATVLDIQTGSSDVPFHSEMNRTTCIPRRIQREPYH
ncbi:MAG: FG-GAP repeat domain-containing protein [Candidatus Thorarchaeota archaeon]